MSYRGITRITLYKRGIVMCQDKMGRQSPPIQGFFSEVVDKIRSNIDPSSVKWFVMRAGERHQVTFDQWLEYGPKLEDQSLPTKPVDGDVMRYMTSCPDVTE